MNFCVNFRQIIFGWLDGSIDLHVFGFVETEFLKLSCTTWEITISFGLIEWFAKKFRKLENLTGCNDLNVVNKCAWACAGWIVIRHSGNHRIKVLRWWAKESKHDIFTEFTANWKGAKMTNHFKRTGYRMWGHIINSAVFK